MPRARRGAPVAKVLILGRRGFSFVLFFPMCSYTLRPLCWVSAVEATGRWLSLGSLHASYLCTNKHVYLYQYLRTLYDRNIIILPLILDVYCFEF